MKLLLDTHVVLWWLDDPNQLADGVVEAIADPNYSSVYVSAVVAWEIAIKRALGKLSAPHELEQAIANAGFEQMPITHSHALATESLPAHHRDPFDRLLIAQARLEDCTLVTRDTEIQKYAVPILLA